jgi:hypothetical protein
MIKSLKFIGDVQQTFYLASRNYILTPIIYTPIVKLIKFLFSLTFIFQKD